jgi:hypothetical protein
VNAFQHTLWWVAAVMVVIFLLMFALPKRPAQHVEGASEADVEVAAEAGAAKESELVG